MTQTHNTQSLIQMFVLFWSTDVTLCHFVSLCVFCFSELRLFVQALWAENLLSSQKSSADVIVVLCVPAQAKMFTVFVFYASCHHPHPARSHVPRWNKNRTNSKAQRILSEQPELFCLKQTLCGHKESWRVKIQSPTGVISWSWLSERDQYLCVCWLMCLHYDMWWY